MTEDDTFNALRKVTFEQMQAEFIRIRNRYRSDPANYIEWEIARRESAAALGWTVPEYQRENFYRINGYYSNERR